MRLNNWFRMSTGGAPPGAAPPCLERSGFRPWDRACFYSSTIRGPDTEQRRHADAFLKLFVEPAVEALDPKMHVIRADGLSSSPITAEVYKHVVCSRLMIADLSYHNPNVLEEIGVRIAISKPLVLISRDQDPIPFNLRDERVVLVNTSEFWRIPAEIEERQREITEFSRWALSPEGRDASPLRRLFPSYKDYID
jgi:hypothetical protein